MPRSIARTKMSSGFDQALEKLKGATESIRLEGARGILEHGDDLSVEAEEAVRNALAVETVPWVRGVLNQILALDQPELEQGVYIDAPRWDERLESVDADVARQAINLSTRRVLHEVAAVVGRARLAAGSDLGDDYLGSETESQLRFLSDVCAGLRRLATATQAPSRTEFDLSQELRALADSVGANFAVPVYVDGPSPFVVVTDKALLNLAAQNILVNAIEATYLLGSQATSRPVMVTWGSSASGAHVSIIDRGPGPGRFLVNVGRAGVSTKEGHPGYGLATASEAMRSLEGTVRIERNDMGGATVVLTWREDE